MEFERFAEKILCSERETDDVMVFIYFTKISMQKPHVLKKIGLSEFLIREVNWWHLKPVVYVR